LSEIYDWFTEGFDTKDLQEAKALIEELGEKVKWRNGRKENQLSGNECQQLNPSILRSPNDPRYSPLE